MFTIDKSLPASNEIKQQFPSLSKKNKSSCDNLLKSAINSGDKYVIVCGPCSADNEDAVKQYCENLARLLLDLCELLSRK